MRLFLLFQSLAKIVHFIDIFSIFDFNWQTDCQKIL